MNIEINELDAPSLYRALDQYRDTHSLTQGMRLTTAAEKELSRREVDAANRLINNVKNACETEGVKLQ